MYKEHKNTKSIKCPHCHKNYRDSDEYAKSGVLLCFNCNKEFEVMRTVRNTYNTQGKPTIKGNQNG